MNEWQIINPFSITLIISACFALFTAVYTWRRRSAPGATPLTVFLIGATIWSVTYAFELASRTEASKLFFSKAEYFGVVLAPTMLLFLVLQYTGKDTRIPRRNYLLFAIEPLAVLIVIWTNEAHGLIWQSWEVYSDNLITTLEVSHGIGFWIHTGYSYLILLAGVILLGQAYRRASAVYRSQTGIILAATLIPWLGNALYIFDLNPIPQLDLTPFAFTLTGLFIAWGLFRFKLFDIAPVAREVIVESLSDGVIVLDLEGRVVDINPPAQSIINRSKDEIIGQPAREVLSAWPDLVHQFQDVIQTQTEISISDGDRQAYFNLRISPVYNRRGKLTGRTVLLQDITASRLAQEQLRRLSRAVEQSASTILITNLDGDIEYVNPAFTHTTGYTVEEAIGANPRIIKSGKMSPTVYENMWKTISSGEVWHGELINKKKNGELYWETVSIAPIKNNQGEITNYVAVKDDITLLKQMQDELVIARDQALDASRLKSQILANVSHDMRTPLGAIVGYTEMLRNGIFGEVTTEQDQKLQDILINCTQLSDFTNNLLAQSEIRSGELHIKKQPVSLEVLLREAQSVLSLVAEQKGLQLKSEIAPEMPDQIIGDYYWLRRILSNLLDNAIKYTDEGSIYVRVFTTEMQEWVMQVADTGIGISEEAQNHIFEPFRKGDQATLGYQRTGAGLGLSIIKEIVDEMEGRLELESKVGKGSTFTIYLPLELNEYET